MFHQFITRSQTVPPSHFPLLVWDCDAYFSALYLWSTDYHKIRNLSACLRGFRSSVASSI